MALIVEEGQCRVQRPTVAGCAHFQSEPPEMARVEVDTIEGDGIRVLLKVERTCNLLGACISDPEIHRVVKPDSWYSHLELVHDNIVDAVGQIVSIDVHDARRANDPDLVMPRFQGLRKGHGESCG